VQNQETVHLERSHKVDKDEAIRRIDTFLDELMRSRLPAGVTIKDLSKTWTGDTMNFSFKPKKGFISLGAVSGIVHVSSNSIAMDAGVPPLITKFVSEQTISKVINKQFDELFRESIA
jgi:Putative polyhydroxyalkanoic acid system protein (PHA_gran_rgn)